MSGPFDQWMPEPPTDYQRGHAVDIAEEGARLWGDRPEIIAYELCKHPTHEALLMLLEVIDWLPTMQREDLRQALIRRIP